MHAHDTSTKPTMDGHVRLWLRLEGLAALIAGAVIYSRLGGDWIWFVPALLAVDISMAGYLRGPMRRRPDLQPVPQLGHRARGPRAWVLPLASRWSRWPARCSSRTWAWTARRATG